MLTIPGQGKLESFLSQGQAGIEVFFKPWYNGYVTGQNDFKLV